MSPDFIYFLPLDISRHASHTFAALFWFCLPAGITAYILFHYLLKQPVWFLLPKSMRGSLQLRAFREQEKGIAPAVGIVLSILVGAVTHIVWDIFTHPSIVTESFLPFLSTTLYEGYGQIVKVYRILQHSSTIIGFLVLGYYLNRFFKAERPAGAEPLEWANTLRNSIRLFLVLSVVSVGIYNGLDAFEYSATSRQFTYFVRYFIISGMNTVFVVLLLTGFVWLILKKRFETEES